MTHYLITYDLNKPGQKYDELYKTIKGLGTSHRHPLDSTWFVETSKSACGIRDALNPKLDTSDKLFVTPVSGWAAWNLSDLASWLNG